MCALMNLACRHQLEFSLNENSAAAIFSCCPLFAKKDVTEATREPASNGTDFLFQFRAELQVKFMLMWSVLHVDFYQELIEFFCCST